MRPHINIVRRLLSFAIGEAWYFEDVRSVRDAAPASATLRRAKPAVHLDRAVNDLTYRLTGGVSSAWEASA